MELDRRFKKPTMLNQAIKTKLAALGTLDRPQCSAESKDKASAAESLLDHRTYESGAVYMSRIVLKHTRSQNLEAASSSNLLSQAQILPPMTRTNSSMTMSSNKSQQQRKRQCAAAIREMASNDLLHDGLLDDDVINALISYCRGPVDIPTFISVTASFCLLSRHTCGRKMLLEHNVVSLLHKLIQSWNSKSRVQAPNHPNHSHDEAPAPVGPLIYNSLATIANLSIESDFEATLVKEKVLELVLQYHTQAPYRYASIMILFNLTSVYYAFVKIHEVLLTIMKVISEFRYGKQQDERKEHIIICKALLNLTLNRANHHYFWDSDILDAIHYLCENTHPIQVRTYAFRILEALAEDQIGRKYLAQAGSTQVLVRLLKSTFDDNDLATTTDPENEEYLRTLFGLLSWLSLEHEACRQMVACVLDLLPTLVKTLSPDLEFVYCTLANLVYHCRNEVQISPQILHLISHTPSTPLGDHYMLFCLAFFTATPATTEVLLNYASTKVVELDSSQDYLQTLILYNLACDRASQSVVKAAGASSSPSNLYMAELLLDRIKRIAAKNQDSRIQEMACQIMMRMTLSGPSQDILHELIPLLPSFLYHSMDSARLSLDCICYMFDALDDSEMTGGAPPTSATIQLEYTGDTTTSTTTTAAASEEPMSAQQHPQLRMIKLLFPHIQELSNGPDREIRSQCAACFARFSTLPRARSVLIEHGLVSSLEFLTGESEDDKASTLSMCIETCSLLSTDKSVGPELLQQGILKSLMSLSVSCPQERLRRACAAAFCNLSAEIQNTPVMVREGITATLVVLACVKTSDVKTKRLCMHTLVNLMRDPENWSRLAQEGLVWALGVFVSHLHELADRHTLALAFCGLCQAPETWKEFCRPSILQSFTPLLDVRDYPDHQAQQSIITLMLQGLVNLLEKDTVAGGNAVVRIQLMESLGPILDTYVCDPIIYELISTIVYAMYPHVPSKITQELLNVTFKLLHTVLDQRDDDSTHNDSTTIVVKGQQNPFVPSLHSLLLLLQQATLEKVGIFTVLPFIDKVIAVVSISQKSFLLLVIQILYNVSLYSPATATAGAASTSNGSHPSKKNNAEWKSIVAMIAFIEYHLPSLCKASIERCAVILRNLSCQLNLRSLLLKEGVVALLDYTFHSKERCCREDSAIGICNIALGQVNSAQLLQQGALKPIVWLVQHSKKTENNPTEMLRLSSAALRKIATPIGNLTHLLAQEELIPTLMVALEQCRDARGRENLVAIISMLSTQEEARSILALHGTITMLIKLLHEDEVDTRIGTSYNCDKDSGDAILKQMGMDCLINLSSHVRPDVPAESYVTSTLLQTFQGEEQRNSNNTQSDRANWQADRTYLHNYGFASEEITKKEKCHLSSIETPSALALPTFSVDYPNFCVPFSLHKCAIVHQNLEPMLPNHQHCVLDRMISRTSRRQARESTLANVTNKKKAIMRSPKWGILASLELSKEVFPKLSDTISPLKNRRKTVR